MVARNFSVLVYDEVQLVSNDETAISYQAPERLARCFRIFVTGTLMNNGPQDVEKVMKLCNWDEPKGWAKDATPENIFDPSQRENLRIPLYPHLLRLRT